jgi:WD40 repeat protein
MPERLGLGTAFALRRSGLEGEGNRRHWRDVNAVAFSLDGKPVAWTSSDETVKLWDSAIGASLQTLKGHWSSVNAVAFSPDGKLVASASSDNMVRLWDTTHSNPTMHCSGRFSPFLSRAGLKMAWLSHSESVQQ